MSKRDYILLASSINEMIRDARKCKANNEHDKNSNSQIAFNMGIRIEVLIDYAIYLSDRLAEDNQRFNKGKFLDACMKVKE